MFFLFLLSFVFDNRHLLYRKKNIIIGASPSGKASAFGADIRRFESYRPSQKFQHNLPFIDFGYTYEYIFNLLLTLLDLKCFS